MRSVGRGVATGRDLGRADFVVRGAWNVVGVRKALVLIARMAGYLLEIA